MSLLMHEYDPVLNRFTQKGQPLIERPKLPETFPLQCECGKRSVVPKQILPRVETIRCPWCDAHWDVRRYTNPVTGQATWHLAKRPPSEIILPEGFER